MLSGDNNIKRLFIDNGEKPTLLGAFVITTLFIFSVLCCLSLGIYGLTLIIEAFSDTGFLFPVFMKGLVCFSVASGCAIGFAIWMDWE